jgi:hypothetical protein
VRRDSQVKGQPGGTLRPAKDVDGDLAVKALIEEAIETLKAVDR